MPANDIVVAITGASGSAYGVRLLELLARAGKTVHLVISPAAVEVMDREIDRKIDLRQFRPSDLLPTLDAQALGRIHYHDYRNFQVGIASGSFLTGGMVICPCSMGTLAAIAQGLSQNLIHRAADVHLKERRKLIVVPRETPLGLIALKNMTAITEAGAVVMPAMPGLYAKPQTINDLIDFIVNRILDQLGIDAKLIERWGT